jgi:methyl-accepting chemotaxis protein
MNRLHTLLLLAVAPLLGCHDGGPTAPQDFEVEGRVALSALVAIGDGHLQQIVGHFEVLASGGDVRSADWERIRGPLAAVAERNVAALTWFAQPDGAYWSVQGGRATGNLSDRPYWPRLMAGQTVIGELVASRATGKSSAIVALPVRDADGDIVGVLGSSVYLDSLSLLIRREIDLQPDQIFFSVDATPIGALQDDPTQIFLDPYALGEPELEAAIREMLTRETGVVNYRFRGKRRTVLYRKSSVSGWWYAFGHVWD